MLAHMYVCTRTCVCVQGHQWWPCHAVPCHAKPSREQAEQGQFLLVLGRSRPLRSGVTQPLLLGWGCPVQPYPMPRHRAGHRSARGTLLLPTTDPGMELRQPLLATVPARLRGMAAPLVCPQPWHRGVGGSPHPMQLWMGVYGPASSRRGKAADGTAGWLHPSS